VFSNDQSGRDLMLIGSVKMLFVNGKHLDMQFSAELIVDAASHEAGKPRLSLMQVFAVSFSLFSHLDMSSR